ncbi:MAG: hypothetical protein R6U51_06400, partial [Anaerolineales bacterium]
IGLFSVAGERYFGTEQLNFGLSPAASAASPSSGKKSSSSKRSLGKSRPAPKPRSSRSKQEPTYEPLVLSRSSDRSGEGM